jgi:iron complex transport system ATP-binding protein
MGDESFSILTFGDLWLGYPPGEFLVEGASGEVHCGEMIALAGRNGTGKSTLLRTIAGIRKPVRGNVVLRQKNLFSFPAYELSKNISFVSTGSSLVENLTVFEMVSLGRHPYTNWWGNIRAKDRRKIHESIRFVGMEDFTNARVYRLSDGERQRVMIAMALAQDTRIMILDEPTAFLDIPNRIGILEVLNKLKSHGRTVIFSTHEFDNIFSYADKVWVIHNRQLLAGAPEDLGLKGAFEHIFSDSGVAFDKDNLRFMREGKFDRHVELAGEDGSVRYWTRRALERGGFRVSERNVPSKKPVKDELSYPQSEPLKGGQKTGDEQAQEHHEAILITIGPAKDAASWIVQTETASHTFHSIYELMKFLTHVG